MIILSLFACFLFVSVSLIVPMLFVFFSVALPVIATVMLACNAFALVVLLVIRHLWKRSGRMERTYIDGFDGWKHVCLLILKYALFILIAWEALMVVGSIALLIWGPLIFA